MYYFCTYFDHNYLPRGLALYDSLRKHCSSFTLWVLCLDQTSFQILEKLNLPAVNLISLDTFEQGDEPLLNAKLNRSKIEYYFTCTPSLPLYILNNWAEVDLITYLDADLYFFASPEPLFEEIGRGSIAIIGHRYPPHLKDCERFGIYNVGWLSFKRDNNALTCIKWWRQQCITWCYDREEDGRFADQKYLDDWPQRFKNVVVLEHKGANLAPWNLSNYGLRSLNENMIEVDEQPLIFFHFHGLKKLCRCLYDPSWIEYGVDSSRLLREQIYLPYIRILLETNHRLLASHDFDSKDNGIRSNNVKGYKQFFQIHLGIQQKKKILTFIKNLINKNYLFVINRYVI